MEKCQSGIFKMIVEYAATDLPTDLESVGDPVVKEKLTKRLQPLLDYVKNKKP